MALSIARVMIAGACFTVGTIAAVGCAAIGLFDTGAPAAAERLGLAPAMASSPALLLRATASPKSLSAAQLAAARETLRRRPLGAVPYYVIGAATAAAGDAAGGGALVDVALRYDPRFAAALLWQTRSEIQAGNYLAATDHALRLLSIRPQEKTSYDMLVLLSGVPKTRARILAALARNPAWRSGYLVALGNSGVSRNFLYKALETGSPVAVNLASDRATFLSGLIQRKEFDRAYTAWVSWLPDDALSSINYVYDGTFRGAPGAPPFNWQLGTIPNGFASIEPGRGLALTFDGSSEVVLAAQTVLLPPGRYRIVTKLDKADGIPSDTLPSLFWRVGCAGQGTALGDKPVRLARTPARTVSDTIEIRDDCPAQTLELRVRPQSYPAQTTSAMRSVTIEAVP